MLDPIVKSIEVPCSQEMAFVVFLDEMHTWWPLAKYTVSAMAKKAAKSITVDARRGGKIVEIAHDDSEHVWGTITSYDPHESFAMDFHIAPPGSPAKAPTLVELLFTALGPERTRVELTQTNWEGLGEWVADIRGGYVEGWKEIFEQAYKAACSLDPQTPQENDQ